jgi:lysozyme family protein
MTNNFPKAISFVLAWEGGYSDDKNDPGGETKFGIPKRNHPDLDIKNLTVNQATQIYRDEYWFKCGCDDLPWPMDLIVFDTSVNLGVSRALVLIQESADWRDYLLNRIGLYSRIVRPGTERYFKGWVNRVIDLKKTVGI